MDPVAVTLLALAGLAIAPKAIPVMIYGINSLRKKINKKLNDRRKAKIRKNRRRLAKGESSITIGKNLERNATVEFTSMTNNNAKRSVNVKEKCSFDLDNDILLRGVVRVRLEDGRIAEDDIYLFQPRIVAANGVAIGPKVSKTGTLLDQNGYLMRVPGDTSIYRGYVPKREVLSGDTFDYVRDSVYAPQGDPLAEFIDIEIPKDKDGNFIPVDKTDKAQMQEFYKYVQGRQRLNMNQHSYLQDLLSAARDARRAYDEARKPVYAKPTHRPDPKEMQRIERARASRAKREAQARAYYGTINRMNMLDSIMHAYNLDEHADHLPGGMGMGMGLGPGMMPLSSMHNGGMYHGGPQHGGPAPGGRHR